MLLDDISFQHRMPIAIDRRDSTRRASTSRFPSQFAVRNVPLFVGLVDLLAPLDLTCAYRYEILWVTTPDSDLHDEELAPRVITDHASPELLSKLSKPVRLDYIEQPLGAVLKDLGLKNDITIEYELQDESEQATLALPEISLRSALGVLLNTHELRCEAVGDKLVITEVEGKKPRPKAIPSELPETAPPANPSSSPFADPTGKSTPQYDPFSGRKSPVRRK